MANDATITFNARVLPDDIAITLKGTMTVTPDDANDKWYYKKTSVTTTSADLIAGQYLDYDAVDQDTAPSAVDVADLVKFIFIKNLSEDDGLVISIDAGTAAFNLADGIFIGPEQSWCARLPNTTVGDVHAISSDIGDVGDASVTCIVAALIDDIA